MSVNVALTGATGNMGRASLDFLSREENVGKIAAWLKEKIHKYGSSKDPAEIFEGACGAPFDPHYYINYLKNKYSELCGITL